MRAVSGLAVLSFLAASSLHAGQVTINFAGLSAVGPGVVGLGTSYTQDGFTFSNTGDPALLIAWGTLNAAHPTGGNSATSLAAYYDSTDLSLAAVNNSPFSLLGIDLASWGFNQGLPDSTFSVTFTGHISGGGTVTQSFDVINPGGTPVLQSFVFNGFSNLDSVSFSQGYFFDGNAFQFNNVVVGDATPEPSTFGLLIGGALLALPRLRKRHSRG